MCFNSPRGKVWQDQRRVLQAPSCVSIPQGVRSGASGSTLMVSGLASFNSPRGKVWREPPSRAVGLTYINVSIPQGVRSGMANIKWFESAQQVSIPQGVRSGVTEEGIKQKVDEYVSIPQGVRSGDTFNNLTFLGAYVSIPQGVRSGLAMAVYFDEQAALRFNSPRGKVWLLQVHLTT